MSPLLSEHNSPKENCERVRCDLDIVMECDQYRICCNDRKQCFEWTPKQTDGSLDSWSPHGHDFHEKTHDSFDRIPGSV
ncbi:hypothetical protein HanIR_Chr11g0546481 [Helianthus annuus]|nr:hypothetical protein HanIR_Chr11g0546481 [Helianthus annuus]